ncbi:basic blue protein [Setaria viridis]|uniref:Phytocyanin domain-containing protein n=1 Tax=Setaria viridis TaxID=4556 RepID=A0A4U6U0X5_SETVI|nr:chemocyanin-like [Setaria viridis]TKW09078.1 hypothetical protein SEVIR_6G068400v2 [Setaria viridis]
MVAILQASLLAVAVAVLATAASGATYTVGGPGGSWDLQTNLTAWASSIDFRSGDELVFKYDASAHNVVEVSSDDYRSCSAASPRSDVLRTGSDVVQLGGVSRYFICGVPGHCAAGMKLEVDPGCTTTLPPPAPPGAPGGITICSGGSGSPTVIMTPGVVSYGSGAAPVSSASLSSVLTTMASLLLAGLTIA